jgi:hypothetical protein|tara:strand:+ start:92 stop:214 length:123 start_codon:yes stop_codon:yes gene_type:complete
MIHIAEFISNLMILGLSLLFLGIGVFILYTVGSEIWLNRK